VTRYQWYRADVARLLLACWLSVFTLQTSDLIALVACDDCTEETRGAADDPCPQNCARCVCCAQRAPVVTVALVDGLQNLAGTPLHLAALGAALNPPPQRILHVPKHLLT